MSSGALIRLGYGRGERDHRSPSMPEYLVKVNRTGPPCHCGKINKRWMTLM